MLTVLPLIGWPEAVFSVTETVAAGPLAGVLTGLTVTLDWLASLAVKLTVAVWPTVTPQDVTVTVVMEGLPGGPPAGSAVGLATMVESCASVFKKPTLGGEGTVVDWRVMMAPVLASRA